jgi:hypothetical protein
LSTKEVQFEELLNLAGLKYMFDDPVNKRFFIGDGEGWIYVYSKSSYPPELIVKIQTVSKSCIRCLTMDEQRLYLFACDVEGCINTFTVGLPGKEKFMKQATEMKGLSKCRVV